MAEHVADDMKLENMAEPAADTEVKPGAELREKPGAEHDSANRVEGTESTGAASAQISSFKDLELKPELLKAIEVEQPTEVQLKCIPEILSGSNLLCVAGNGMGRRTAIVLATLQQLQPEDGKISTLILCHTRISAYKFAEIFEHFSMYLTKRPKVIVLCGGVPPKQDLKALADGPHIVVGTIGKIKMHLQQKSKPLNLNDVVQIFIHESNAIIDAKDTEKALQEIEKHTSRQKQVVMFCGQLKEESKPLYQCYFKEQNVTIDLTK